MLTLNEYQRQLLELTNSIQVEGDKTLFNCVGMAEEAGECLGKLKRAMRGEGFDREGYILELGDVLGYLAIACKYQNVDLAEAYEKYRYFESTCQETLESTIDLSKVVNEVLEDVYNEFNLEPFERYAANVLHLIARCAVSVQADTQEVMSANLQKLCDRLERTGTLLGSGDNR